MTQCLSLLKLEADVQQELNDGRIAASTAYAIARASEEQTKQKLLEAARNGQLSRDDASEAVRKRAPGGGKACKIACRLPGKLVTTTCQGRLTLQDIEGICQQLLRESRRAIKQGLDVSTFERVLADLSRQASV